MSEVNQTTESKKTTKKSTTTKKTTRKTTPKKAATEPIETVALTPELMAQFMALLQQNQVTLPQTEATSTQPKSSAKPMTRAELNKRSEDVVDVYSVVNGTVIYESPKTKMQYHWTSVGECVPMAIGELITMYSVKKAFLTKPWIRVEDEGFNQAFDLAQAVEVGEKLEQAETILKADLSEIRAFVATLNEFAKEELANQVFALIKDEKLTNIHVIRELEHLLEKELMI